MIENLSGSALGLVLRDLETLEMPHAKAVLKEAFRALALNGVIEFPILNFAWCVECYQVRMGTDERLSEILCTPNRRSVWDEKTVVRALFEAGFYRIWTGRVPEYPEWMMYCKALKLDKTELLS